MQIHEKIQQGEYPNCVQMAREMEVSLRTMKRDVQFMKDRLHLPIEYDAVKYGFYYTQSVDQFPRVEISEAEMFAMLVAHKAIAQYHGTPFQQPLEMAFQKITGQLNQQEGYSLDNFGAALSFRPFAPEDADLNAFQIITRALRERRALKFRYKNLGAKTVQERLTHPYHLACIENHWYLFAFDVNRQAIRTFALGRLTQPKLLSARFKMPKQFDADEYLRGSFSVYKGHDDYEVVIEFDAWATDLIRGRHWHSSQQFQELPGSGSRLTMRLNSIEEIDRWVLGWGTHATVVRPKAVQERIRSMAQDLLQRYK